MRKQKNKWWLALWCLCFVHAHAQNTQQVTAIQYYFNNDPGTGVTGNGAVLPVTPVANYTQTLQAAIPANLPVGFNTVMVRVKDEHGRWSIAERSMFYVFPQVSGQINAYQYYYDTDPGLGIAGNGSVTSITPTNNFNQTITTIIPSSIGYGFHTLYFRTRDTNGQWSIAERSSFYYMPSLATQINAYQYFFDNDPGIGVAGNGGVVNVSPTAALNQAVSVTIPASLTTGFHTLYFRTKGTNGQWSIAERSMFYVFPQVSGQINAYQYYYDTDPGLGIAGNGSVTNITPTNNFNQTITTTIPSSIGYGFHTLYFRTRDTNGLWSIAERSSFYYMPPLATQINAYQYFFDNDPGIGVAGNGGVVNVSPTVAFNQVFNVGYPSNLTSGQHTLFFRTRSTTGQWSVAERSNFTIPSMIVAYQYYFDTDPGVGIAGNGAVVAVSATPSLTQQLNVTIPPSLTAGFHNMYVRTMDDMGSWSIAERHYFLVQTPPAPIAINAYQYYFDSDPGVGNAGNGAVVNVSATSSLTQSLNIVVPPTLNSGFHNMYMRTRSTTGEWSIADRQVFYLDSTIKTQTITKAEYYFDNDPGVGNAYSYTNFGPTSALNINDTLTVQLPCMLNVTHFMYMRTRDSFGRWSIAERDTVVVDPGIARPVISVTSDTSFCTGDSVILYTFPAAGITCQWYQNGLPISGATSSSYVAYLSGSYMVEIACAANASSTGSDPITVTAQPPTTYYRDYDNDGFGAAANFLVSCVTPVGYVTNSTDCNDSSSTVYPGATEICFNGIDENCNGQIDENCCVSSVAATSITSDAGNNEICVGNNVTLTLNGGSLGSNANWKWYKNTCGGLANGIGTGINITVTPASTTTYFVRAEGCDTTLCVSITIKVSTLPVTSLALMPFGGMPANVCAGTVANLTITPVSRATFYIWDVPTGSYFNGNPLNVSPYTTTTPGVTVTFGNPSGSLYNVGVQAGNACGLSLRQSQKVRGLTSVPSSISGSLTACANTSVSYSTPAVTGASSYFWTITGNATVIGTGTTATVTFGPAWTGGTLCVASQTSCNTSPTKCISIGTSAASLGTISGTFTACPNSTITYSVPASAGAASYTWTLPPNSSGISTTNSIAVSFGSGYNAVGSICVSVTSVCGVTSALKCKTVAPGLPSQPNSIAGPTNGLCGQSVVYSCPSQGAGVTFTWTVPSGASILSGQGSTSINVQFGTFTTGSVCVTANNTCGSSAVRCIGVKGAPATPGAITAIPSSWCANTSGIEFDVNVANITGSYVLSWAYPTSTIATYVLGAGNSSFLLLDWGTGTGNINVTASNACGSGTKTSTWGSSCREGEVGMVSTFSVSPNPTTGIININYSASKGTTQISVLDLAGRVVITQSQSSVEGINNTKLDMSNLAKGAYMLHVQSTQGNKLVKVVVE